MPENRPLLTIAIPTYNRVAFLAQLLEVLAPQIANEPRVELIISDNASPDGTEDLVSRYCHLGLPVRYLRNTKNIGPDANFVQCYEFASGEYIWIVGDDDVIRSGALQHVLVHLETGRYDLLHIRAAEFHGAYQDVPAPEFPDEIKEFRPQDFALYVSTGFTFISSMIIRKASLASLPSDEFKKQIGTNLVQLSWTFAMLRGNPRCACILDPLVASKIENSGGYGAFQVFGRNLHAMVREFFGVDSPIGRAILNRTVQSWFPWAILQANRGIHSSHLPEDAKAILYDLFRKNPRYWFFVRPFFLLPLPLAEAWWLSIRVINRADRFFGYPIAR